MGFPPESPSERASRPSATRLLVIGGSGFVGRNLVRYLSPRCETHFTYLSSAVPEVTGSPLAHRLDIRDADAVARLVDAVSPTAVIHAAGNKDVRYCEAHEAEALLTNGKGTGSVARACRSSGAFLAYLSTDLVFACTSGGYREEDLPEPRTAYGRTKLEGERRALDAGGEVAVCRSGGIYGTGSPLLGWVAGELENGRPVEAFTDVFNTPTYSQNLAQMLEAAVLRRLTGVLHTVGRERVSRFGLFSTYACVFGHPDSLVRPATSAPGSLLQADASLSTEATAARLRVPFNSVSEGLTHLRAEREHDAEAHPLLRE